MVDESVARFFELRVTKLQSASEAYARNCFYI